MFIDVFMGGFGKLQHDKEMEEYQLMHSIMKGGYEDVKRYLEGRACHEGPLLIDWCKGPRLRRNNVWSSVH